MDKTKLLIVEDDLPQTFLIKESLDQLKYDISNILDGREALEYLLTTNDVPEIILMDYHLPGIDGITILNKLKDAGKKYNIIFLTADYSIDTAIQSINSGALEFIPKDNRFVNNIPAIVEKAYQTIKAQKEREQFEHAYIESEARFKIVMEASKDGIFELSFAENNTQISPNNALMLGYSINEMPKSYLEFFELLYPDDQKLLISKYKEHLQNNSPICEVEIRIKAKNGNYKWILHRGIIAEKDKDGSPLRIIGTHSDISERKANEEKIIKANLRLSTLIGNLPGIVYSCKNSDFFEKEFIGGRVEQITGFKELELANHDKLNFGDIIYNEDKIEILNLIIQSIASKTDFDIYYRIISKSNEIRWVLDHGKLIFNDKGEITSIEGYITDITEKKLFDEALQKSEEEKNIILDNSMQAFILLNANGEILTFNKVANHRTIIMMGKTLKEGFKLLEFLPESEKQKMQEYISNATTGHPAYWENPFEYRDTISWFDNVLVPVFISREEIKYICYTSSDITERKLSEEKILASESLYNTTINSINDIICVVDENLNFLLINEALIRFSKVNNFTDEMLGKYIYDVFPMFQKLTEPLYSEVFKSGKNIVFEDFFVISGKTLFTEIKITPIYQFGKIIRAVTIIRDLTERKNFEKEIMNAIIDTEEKERKRFSEDLHDGLGSILSTIKIYINTLHNETLAKKQHDELVVFTNQLIDEAIQNSKEIANNLSPNIIKRFGLASAISSLCTKIQATSDVSINFDASKFGHKLKEDQEISLYRIISELINNSIKHSGANKLEIVFKSETEKLKIHFADNGHGFNFQQTIQSKSQGLGLQNIINRVNSMNGSFDTGTMKMKGFNINFEFYINK